MYFFPRVALNILETFITRNFLYLLPFILHDMFESLDFSVFQTVREKLIQDE